MASRSHSGSLSSTSSWMRPCVRRRVSSKVGGCACFRTGIVRDYQSAIRGAPDIEFDHVRTHFNGSLQTPPGILRRLRGRATVGYYACQPAGLCLGLGLPAPSFSSFSASSRMCCSC